MEFRNATKEMKSTHDYIDKISQTLLSVLIPDNATNGDVIMAMFPNAKWYVNEDNEVFTDHVTLNDRFVRFNIDWWNAPYKKGVNEE